MQSKIRTLSLLAVVALLAGFVLAACGQPGPAQPTEDLSAELVATIVAQTLEAQSGQPTAAATPQLAETATQPALPPTETPAPSPTLEPTATQALATATPEPTATATTVALPSPTPPESDPRQSLGGPSFTDPMDSGTYWPTDNDKYTEIDIEGGRLHYTALTDTDGWRLLTWPDLRDFYVEIRGEFEECSGTDHYGLIVRVPERKAADRGYLFGISCNGRFSLSEWDGTVEPNGRWTSHIYWKESAAINRGAGQTNRVGLMAVGSRLTLYVNGVKIGELNDDTFDEGAIGLYVGSDETNDLTVQIDELNLWDLSE